MKKILPLLIGLALLGSRGAARAPIMVPMTSRLPLVAAGGGGGSDNIAFRSKNQFINSSANGGTVTEPASAAQNDILIALAVCGNTSTSLGAPSGWTVLTSGVGSGGAGFDFRYSVAWIRRGASAPSLTWTMSTAAYVEIHVVDYSGVVTTGNPYEAFTDGGTTAVDSTAANPPSVTTLTANDRVVAGFVDWAGSGTAWTASTGYTLRTDNTAGNDAGIEDKKVVAAGAEDPAALTGRGAGNSTKYTVTIALKSS